MIQARDRAALAQRLFDGGTPLFAVLDGARSNRIHDLVRRSGRPTQCLYDGKLAPGMVEVAPHLVELQAGHAFTETLLTEGWGQSWGSFIGARATLADLRHHLRRFLKVRTEDGRALLFRHYDPRVLRAYLPTCTADEINTFFGPVARFIAEEHAAAGTPAALVFERRAGALAVDRFPLPAADASTTPR